MFNWITHLMNSLGYPAIVFLMFLENLFPPIPLELVMPLAGFTATQGKLSLVGIVIAGTLGSVLGTVPVYYIGKTVGEERLKAWADKHGKWLTISGHDIEKAKAWFDRHDATALFVGRLVPGIRSLISIPAGINKMNLPLFLVYTTLGTALWSALLAYAGYLLGGNYGKVDNYLDLAAYVVTGAVIVIYIVRVVKQHKAQSALR